MFAELAEENDLRSDQGYIASYARKRYLCSLNVILLAALARREILRSA